MHKEPQYDSQTPDPHVPWCFKCESHTPYHEKWIETTEAGNQKLLICDLCDSYLMKPATVSLLVLFLLVSTILLGIGCVALGGFMGVAALEAEKSLVGSLLGFIALVCILVMPCFWFYRYYKKKQTRWLAFVNQHGRDAEA